MRPHPFQKGTTHPLCPHYFMSSTCTRSLLRRYYVPTFPSWIVFDFSRGSLNKMRSGANTVSNENQFLNPDFSKDLFLGEGVTLDAKNSSMSKPRLQKSLRILLRWNILGLPTWRTKMQESRTKIPWSRWSRSSVKRCWNDGRVNIQLSRNWPDLQGRYQRCTLLRESRHWRAPKTFSFCLPMPFELSFHGL